MAGPNTLAFTDDNFEKEVLQSAQPVLVDFWAEWCMPCHAIAPIIEELADEYVGRLKVVKLNTDYGRDSAVKMGISAIPTVMLFKDGQVAMKIVGANKSKRDFKAEIDKVVG